MIDTPESVMVAPAWFAGAQDEWVALIVASYHQNWTCCLMVYTTDGEPRITECVSCHTPFVSLADGRALINRLVHYRREYRAGRSGFWREFESVATTTPMAEVVGKPKPVLGLNVGCRTALCILCVGPMALGCCCDCHVGGKA